MSRRQHLRNFYQHPWRDKWRFGQAYIGLGLAWLVIHTLPFRWLAPRLGHRMAESPTDLHSRDLAEVQRVAWAVQHASRLTPWPSVCLPQAITAKLLLRRQGISSTLYLGAAFDDTHALTAHAWLRCGPHYVTGGAGHLHFGVVATFAEQEGEH